MMKTDILSCNAKINKLHRVEVEKYNKVEKKVQKIKRKINQKLEGIQRSNIPSLNLLF